MPPRVARTWIRAIVLAAVAGYVLAVSGLAKARDKGGTGFQLLMVGVAGAVLLLALVVRRRAIAGNTSDHGQHVLWLGFIRVAATIGAVLSVVATIRSTPQQQSFPAIMAVLDLWLLTVVIRLDHAATDVAAVGSAS